MIKGRTLIKRDIHDKPKGEKKIGSIPAGIEITATENVFQWLHLVGGGWVSAGPLQRYIEWEVVPDAEPPPTPPDAPPQSASIKGKTLQRRDVYDKPRGEKRVGSIDAGVEIVATEHEYQWLHLVDGGWVNAGSQQQYIKWEVVPDPVPPPDTPLPPSQPDLASIITEIKRQGRIATLRVDWQNPKWDFAPRNTKPMAYPQTVTFNSVCDYRKGPRIPLTDPVLEYLGRLNGKRTKERILTPQAGWINHPTVPPTIERLTWAANHVVVKETRVEQDVEWANVFAVSCHASNLDGTFFDKDMRLVVHKFNAITRKRTMLKLTGGHDCYTPFITDPDVNNGDMWIRSDYLELWPHLPFVLSDGTEIIEYEFYGFDIYGVRADGSTVLLRDPKGFKTNWMIKSPELPI